MAKPNEKPSKLNSLKAFAKDTIASFGLGVIMRAAMAPHALRYTV